MNKQDYIMALLRHCKQINLYLPKEMQQVLFFMFHAGMPLEEAKEYLTTFHNRKST